ncbi:MAG: SMC-Scp complex subunit ScpB [Candidatus Liptonbacteria bacterium]|nr:SMC-Scp complex subunit ScpB [Candidatus Liptonbacteria bacterium]
MESNSQNKIQALEAALFIYGEPMSFKKAADILKIKPGEIPELIQELKNSLANGGLDLIINDESVQLVTKPNFADMIETIIKEELSSEITPAALETLAIISYLGPLPRARVDYIRGVNSSYILRTLLLRGLIVRTPDPKRGNAFLYKASFDLLKFLGVSSVSELPDFSHYKNLLTKAEAALEGETKDENIKEDVEVATSDDIKENQPE